MKKPSAISSQPSALPQPGNKLNVDSLKLKAKKEI